MKIKLIYLAAGNSRRFNSQRMQNTEPPQSEAENKLLYVPLFIRPSGKSLSKASGMGNDCGNTVSGD